MINNEEEIDLLEDMPAEAIAELEAALAASETDTSGTPHDEVMKLAYSWLKS